MFISNEQDPLIQHTTVKITIFCQHTFNIGVSVTLLLGLISCAPGPRLIYQRGPDYTVVCAVRDRGSMSSSTTISGNPIA